MSAFDRTTVTALAAAVELEGRRVLNAEAEGDQERRQFVDALVYFGFHLRGDDIVVVFGELEEEDDMGSEYAEFITIPASSLAV